LHYPAKDDGDRWLWWWRSERPRVWDV